MHKYDGQSSGDTFMFQLFFRRRKIRKYAKELPLTLIKRYGKKRFYSRVQVDAAITRRGINPGNQSGKTENCYTFTKLCSPKVFNQIREQSGEDYDYAIIRGKISNTLFDHADFTFSTLLAETTSSLLDSNNSGNIYLGDGSCE